MQFSVDFDLSQLDKYRRPINLTQPLRQSAAYMERITKTRFAREVDPDNKQWVPLAPRTLLKKRSGSILRETGVLVNATASRIVGNTAYIENPTEYGIYHQLGAPNRNLPQRAFLGFFQADIQRINQIFQKFVEQSF